MTTRTGADNAATRDDPPVANDFGLVVRPLGPFGPVIQGNSQLLNGAQTAVTTAVAVRVLAANEIPTGTVGSRVTAVVQNTGTANVRVGVGGVTATTGLRLIPNMIAIYDVPENYPGEIWAIGEAADSVVFAQEFVLA